MQNHHEPLANKEHEDHCHSGDDNNDEHSGHSVELFRQKFWLSLLLTVPVVLLSSVAAGFFGYNIPDNLLVHLISPVLGTVLFLYSGLVFLKSARHELAARQPGMMTLISLAITVAFAYSWAVSLGLKGMDFWWELASLITIMVLGHWLEMKSIAETQNALGELTKLLPDTAEVVHGSETKIVEASSLELGDIVLIRPGARIPADGLVLQGRTTVDESLLTGESHPQKKQENGAVIGGSLNIDGSVRMKVVELPGEGMLGGIMDAVAKADESRSRSQVLADRFAGWLFFVAIITAGITGVYWMTIGGGDLAIAMERVVTVLIIACPHALGLAVPLVVSIASWRAVRSGLLVRSREGLEQFRNVNTVVFDKTGTLTTGEQSVVAVIGEDQSAVVQLAAAVEFASEHPIARAVVKYANKQKIDYSQTETNNFQAITGRGVRAVIGESEILVGSQRLMEDSGVEVDVDVPVKYSSHTTVFISSNMAILGAIVLGDNIRSESYDAIASLKSMGIQAMLLTGDNKAVAAAVADELTISDYAAGVLPAEKAEMIRKLQAKGRKVAMVGDGINDAPALIQAEVGVAVGAGTAVAIESADIVLLKDNPMAVIEAVKLSRATYRKMVQNLAWGAGYNIIMLPLATGMIGGIMVSPAIGAVLMSASTVVVALNAQLLRRR